MASGTSISTDTVVQCPCHEFKSIQTIRGALDSEERTNALVAWLADTKSGRRLSCQTQQAELSCTRRVRASFSILNGIRDAVRPFLETATKAEPSYDEAFPTLGAITQVAPNVLVARKKTKKKVSLDSVKTENKDSTKRAGIEKRRIRLELVPASVKSEGNIANLTSTPLETIRSNNKNPVDEWPLMTTNKTKNVVKKNMGGSKKPMRRIKPAPVTGAWGAATTGNISSLPSSNEMSVPSKADFDKLKQASTWSKRKTDDERIGSKTKPCDDNVNPIPSDNPLDPSTEQRNDSVKESQSQRENLARVYSALILNRLVPSTALELHLLVRLLNAKERSTLSEEESTAVVLQSLFASSTCCQSFAIGVLTRVKRVLRNLSLEMIEGFVNCQPFASMLPNVTSELKAVVQRRKEKLLLPGVEAISIIGGSHSQMPLLTLPFDHDRDSRHNYKSRDDAVVYRNREESRDAFLYQLRAFQNIRGTVVDATQAERSVDRIRVASRNLIQGLLKSNMCWFAQLFCELLMQIGLVPMEETDKELLNIAGKDKLQKLHKRFSAKGTQASKSTKNLILDPSKSVGTASPVTEAQQYFPGRQEFFFIFILSTDCYSFCAHLKNRLKFELKKLRSSSESMKGMEKRLLQLKVLSKFLGLVVFSPSWHDSGYVGGSYFDLLSEFNPEFDIIGIIKQASRERYLVITIPWVVEFLRMAKWSPTLQKSDGFERLLSILLGLRDSIRFDENEIPDNLSVNMQAVSFYLETLFGDIVGLERSASVAPESLAEPFANTKTKDDSKRPDECSFIFSNSLLFVSNPHVEELFTLLSSQTHNTPKSQSSRKLTPHSIGGSFGSSSDPLGSPSSTSFSPLKTKTRISRGSDSDRDSQGEGEHQISPVVGKLVEAFFHQHQDLKSICEFVVDQTLQNVATRMRTECIIPILKQKRQDVEGQVMKEARLFLSTEVEKSIPRSLDILCPPTLQPRVIDVATKLTIAHAVRLGEATIDSLVRLESKKLSLETTIQLKKQASTSETKEYGSKTENGDEVMADDTLVVLRDALANHAWERRLDFLLIVLENAKKAILQSENGPAPATSRLSQALDLGAVPLVRWCLREDCCKRNIRWNLLSSFLSFSVLLCDKTSTTSAHHSFEGKISSFFSDEEAMNSLIGLGLSVIGDDAGNKAIAELLRDLTRCQLICPVRLEEALSTCSIQTQETNNFKKGHFKVQ